MPMTSPDAVPGLIQAWIKRPMIQSSTTAIRNFGVVIAEYTALQRLSERVPTARLFEAWKASGSWVTRRRVFAQMANGRPMVYIDTNPAATPIIDRIKAIEARMAAIRTRLPRPSSPSTTEGAGKDLLDGYHLQLIAESAGMSDSKDAASLSQYLVLFAGVCDDSYQASAWWLAEEARIRAEIDPMKQALEAAAAAGSKP